ncbi:MAG: hypothetical protein P8012_13640 [Desulfobacterales bacterium]
MKAKTILLMIFLLMVPIIAHAQNQNDLIQSLYLKSGMDKQVKQLPLLIRAGVEQAFKEDDRINQLPRHTKSAISASIQEAFATKRLKKTIIKEMKVSMTVKDLNKVRKWLDSPLGKKCTRLEEAASTPETLSEIKKFAAQLQHMPPASNRLDILRRLDAAVKATKTNVEITMNTQLAVAFAVVKALPLEQQVPLNDIAAQLEKNRPQVEAAMKTQTLLFALYTYQDLTNAELEKYIQFATSPAGTKYHGATISGFKKALLDGSLKWGESIADILNQSNHQSET